MTRKLVHLLKRSADEDVAAFQAALLQLRGADPAAPEGLAYSQSHTLLKGYARGDLLFDAVEEFAFPAAEACRAFAGSAAYAALWQRRLPAIDKRRSHVMEVEVHRVKDEALPEDAVINIEFVTYRPGMALEPFRRYWREVHGPLAATIPSVLRYEQNHTVLEAYDRPDLPRYDGLAITWFESTQAMREGAETEAYRLTRADEPNFLPDGHLPIIIVREVIGAHTGMR